jgi:hypothetical protein
MKNMSLNLSLNNMALGMQGMSSAPPNLMSSVPEGFRQIGMPIHMAFDKIADAAETGATTKEILTSLGAAMNRCVACHAAYRIASRLPAFGETNKPRARLAWAIQTKKSLGHFCR